MVRLSKYERKQAVLDAAAQRVKVAEVGWQKSLTYGDLENATGIDRAQIARDFGSKDRLIDELVAFLLRPEDVGERLDAELTAAGISDSLDAADAGSRLAAGMTSYYDRHAQDLESEALVWAVGDRGSTEWQASRELHREQISRTTAEVESILSRAKTAGAVPRDGLSGDQIGFAVACLAEGLKVRRDCTDDLVADDLLDRAVKLLLSAAIGNDARTPADEHEGVRFA